MFPKELGQHDKVQQGDYYCYKDIHKPSNTHLERPW